MKEPVRQEDIPASSQRPSEAIAVARKLGFPEEVLALMPLIPKYEDVVDSGSP